MELGCKEWGTNAKNGDPTYRWLAKGVLLADGLCIGHEYVRSVAPFKGNTIVYSTVEEPKIREISLSEGTVSVDFELTMRWLDPNIKTQFDDEDKAAGFVVISEASLDDIWTSARSGPSSIPCPRGGSMRMTSQYGAGARR